MKFSNDIWSEDLIFRLSEKVERGALSERCGKRQDDEITMR